jgi:hypothetical protein
MMWPAMVMLAFAFNDRFQLVVLTLTTFLTYTGVGRTTL